jgi:hypothetical protein
MSDGLLGLTQVQQISASAHELKVSIRIYRRMLRSLKLILPFFIIRLTCCVQIYKVTTAKAKSRLISKIRKKRPPPV